MKNNNEFYSEYQLDEFNDFSFDYLDTLEIAKEIFSFQLKTESIIEGEFDSLSWRFLCKNRYRSVLVEFEDIFTRTLFKDLDSDSIVLSLKCWFLTQLPNRSIESLKKYLDNLKEILVLSNFFHEDQLENTRLFLQMECNDSKKWNLCVPSLNFLDFLDESDIWKNYRTMFIDIKKDINIEDVSGKVRKLPSAHDVLTFSFILNEFISNTRENTEEYFKYYPVYIWWTLSNIIPMRPSEFCAIERNSLKEEKGNYFITLPRIKQKQNKHKIQVIDKILITEKIYRMLTEYRQLTERFGKSITLISPKSFKTYQHSEYLENRFTYSDLQLLIYRFYKEIVQEQYKYNFQDQVTPGDTRHFAFLNLMRQGYHPVEIARLGGHTSLQAQYHYQQHLEYWVDVEIVQLMHRSNTFKDKQKKTMDGLMQMDDEFIHEKVLKPQSSEFMCEVEIGYCTDPDMFCQTDKCFFCPSWRISYDEFLLKKSIIQKELQTCKTDIDRLTKTMKNLFCIAFESQTEVDVSENNLEFNKDLYFTKKQLDTTLHNLIALSQKIRKEDFPQ